MSSTELYNIIGIAVGTVTLIGVLIAVIRTYLSYRKQQREARDSKVQKRIEFLRDQLALLQNASSEYEKYVHVSGGMSHMQAARASARSAMQACGDVELNTIADRFIFDNWKVADDLNAMGDGIKATRNTDPTRGPKVGSGSTLANL